MNFLTFNEFGPRTGPGTGPRLFWSMEISTSQNSDSVYQKINNLFIFVLTESDSGKTSDKSVKSFPSSVII